MIPKIYQLLDNKILPGPNSTERGLFVLKTGSLIVNPANESIIEIYNFTCILIALNRGCIPIKFNDLTN